MPKPLEDLVKKLENKGYSKSSSFAIGTSVLQKKGVLKQGTQKLNRKKKK